MSGAATLERLTAGQIDAVADLWRRDRRRLTTAFTGTSMLPAIEPGQPVVVECGAEPAVGDIAVFRIDQQVGVHRTVLRAGQWILTWGDANPLPDEPIATTQIIGVIPGAPDAPYSLRRALLLRLIASPRMSMERVARRVRFLHRLRAACAQGPLVFMRKAVRAVRRSLPC